MSTLDIIGLAVILVLVTFTLTLDWVERTYILLPAKSSPERHSTKFW